MSGVLDNNPNVDSKTSLDLEDDAAHVNWGGDWRMPTKVLSFDPVKAGSSSGYDKRDYYNPMIDEDGTIWSNILLNSYSRTEGAFIRPVCPK